MADLRKRIKDQETPLQQLLESIPGFDGYREREIRRTADKLLREHLVQELDRVASSLKQVVAKWARARKLAVLTDLDRLSRLLGKARDTLRFADYGYTGFFDAVKIKEDELDKLYEHDLSLRSQIGACQTAVAELAAADETALEVKMHTVETAIADLQQRIDRRGEVATALVP